MSNNPAKTDYLNRRDRLVESIYHWACGKAWLRRPLLGSEVQLPQTTPLERAPSLEIVSHCWGYSHLLVHQLWSLVAQENMPSRVRFTVFYNREDRATQALLNTFAAKACPGLDWNFVDIAQPYLFRRAIGRNRAALNTDADWIWFTDCDLIFGTNSINSLITSLQKVTAPLVFPAYEYRSAPLPDDHPLFAREQPWESPREVHPAMFSPVKMQRATGPLQIVRGEVARQLGYCQRPALFQKPARRWCKATEDRIFRWSLNTQGVPVDAGPFYRIQHQSKGRYEGSAILRWLRLRNHALRHARG